MTEIPEHLLQRSKERRKALGLPVDGDDARRVGRARSRRTRRARGRDRGPGRRGVRARAGR